MDPFQGLADFILGRLKQGVWAQWARFIFELAFSAIVSFLVVGGGALISTRNWPVGIGSGMVAAGIYATALFRRESSKLTKGMMVVLPSEEAAEEITAEVQEIDKSQK
jgi:predicted phage tail protein